MVKIEFDDGKEYTCPDDLRFMRYDDNMDWVRADSLSGLHVAGASHHHFFDAKRVVSVKPINLTDYTVEISLNEREDFYCLSNGAVVELILELED